MVHFNYFLSASTTRVYSEHTQYLSRLADVDADRVTTSLALKRFAILWIFDLWALLRNDLMVYYLLIGSFFRGPSKYPVLSTYIISARIQHFSNVLLLQSLVEATAGLFLSQIRLTLSISNRWHARRDAITSVENCLLAGLSPCVIMSKACLRLAIKQSDICFLKMQNESAEIYVTDKSTS